MSLDLYNLANNSDRTQIFYGVIGPNNGTTVYYWVKPRGISMVQITVIGAGGGGAGGGSASNGVAANGGGGGGSSAPARLVIPSIFITDELTVICGSGGLGGAAASNGNGGGPTYVICARGSTGVTQTQLIYVTGGSPGLANRTGGIGGGVASSLYSTLGNFSTSNGIQGQFGGAGGSASNTVYNAFEGIPLTEGGGGGGKSAANVNGGGSNILGSGNVPTVLNGTNGRFNMTPFYSLGGGGGNANFGLTGFKGGDGAIGSGGGGGGAGLTGGAGGNGGPSMVIITCW
jgi:hypothetical protein